MIKHIVCWKIKDGFDKAETGNAVRDKLLALKNEIQEIKYLEVGLNAHGAPQSNHDVILISEFDSFAALDTYLKHPAHVKAGSFIKEHTTERVAVDYAF